VSGRNPAVISPVDKEPLIDRHAPGALHSGGAEAEAEAIAGAKANAAATETRVLSFMSAERRMADLS